MKARRKSKRKAVARSSKSDPEQAVFLPPATEAEWLDYFLKVVENKARNSR